MEKGRGNIEKVEGEARTELERFERGDKGRRIGKGKERGRMGEVRGKIERVREGVKGEIVRAGGGVREKVVRGEG
jgi:hypothetical protein